MTPAHRAQMRGPVDVLADEIRPGPGCIDHRSCPQANRFPVLRISCKDADHLSFFVAPKTSGTCVIQGDRPTINSFTEYAQDQTGVICLRFLKEERGT